MSEYQWKTGKLGKKVTGAYQKVEDAFVDRFLEKDESGEGELHLKTGKVGQAVLKEYQEIEDTFVGAYKKVEDAFVGAFLEKVDPDQGKTDDTCWEKGGEERMAEDGADGTRELDPQGGP